MKRYWKKFVVILAALACLYASYRYTLHRMVEAKLNAIRAQGYPVTLAELDKWYPEPPPGQNAADVLTNAFALYAEDWKKLNPLPFGVRNVLPPQGEPLPVELKQKITDYISDHREVLELLHKATPILHCRYPVQHGSYFSTIVSSTWGTRLCIRLFLLEALQRAENSNLEDAVNSLTAAVELDRTLDDAPFYEAPLSREFTASQTGQAVAYALSRSDFTERQIERMQHAFSVSAGSSEHALARTYVGERCQKLEWLNTILDRVREWNGGYDFGYVHCMLYKAAGLFEMDELSYLNSMDDYLPAFQSGFPDRLRLFRLAQDHAETLPRYTNFLRVMLPRDYDVLADASRTARLRCAIAVLNVERYRLSNAGLPDKLPEPVPADPFDGQPLRYKKLTKGYVVYSVGKDSKDDGGDEKKDITFTVER